MDMPISVESFHNDIRSVIKKYNSAFVSPEDIDFAINKAAIDELESLSKSYIEGDRFRADGELLKRHSFSGSATVRDLPSDVFRVVGVLNDDNEGDLLPQNLFNDRAKSTILAPSVERPVATIYELEGTPTIEILPATSTHQIVYWRNPVDCKYNYTETNGVISYDATGSTDIDFPRSSLTYLSNRVLTYITPSVKDSEAAQLESNILRT